MNFVSRSYNNFSLGETGATIIKTSSNEKLSDEIDYYKSLPDSLKPYFARFISSTKWDQFAALELEYYAYPNLGDLMLKGKPSEFWHKVFDFYKHYIDDYKKLRVRAAPRNNFEMLINKTEVEYNKLRSDLKGGFHLNGKEIRPFPVVWERIRKHINQHLLDEEYFYCFHGDLNFSNTLAGEHPSTGDVVLKFIDPRGKYGDMKYGSVYYDLAKLYHSINGGYEYLINDRYHLSTNGDHYSLVLHNYGHKALHKTFAEVFGDYDLERIKLIEGLLYISMCHRHGENPERQLAMYLTGLNILNEQYERLGQDGSN